MIPLLGIDPREMTTYIHTKTWTGMFIAAQLTIARKWKQPSVHHMNKLNVVMQWNIQP